MESGGQIRNADHDPESRLARVEISSGIYPRYRAGGSLLPRDRAYRRADLVLSIPVSAIAQPWIFILPLNGGRIGFGKITVNTDGFVCRFDPSLPAPDCNRRCNSNRRWFSPSTTPPTSPWFSKCGCEGYSAWSSEARGSELPVVPSAGATSLGPSLHD